MPEKRAGLAQKLALSGILSQDRQHLGQGMSGKDRLPLTQGVLLDSRVAMCSTCPANLFGRIDQFRLSSDLLLNELVEFQTAFIDEIMPPMTRE
jgi:hypothetical protein